MFRAISFVAFAISYSHPHIAMGTGLYHRVLMPQGGRKVSEVSCGLSCGSHKPYLLIVRTGEIVTQCRVLPDTRVFQHMAPFNYSHESRVGIPESCRIHSTLRLRHRDVLAENLGPVRVANRPRGGRVEGPIVSFDRARRRRCRQRVRQPFVRDVVRTHFRCLRQPRGIPRIDVCDEIKQVFTVCKSPRSDSISVLDSNISWCRHASHLPYWKYCSPGRMGLRSSAHAFRSYPDFARFVALVSSSLVTDFGSLGAED